MSTNRPHEAHDELPPIENEFEPGWKALAEAIAPGARVMRLRRLTGGAGGTDAYDVTLDRSPHSVVTKLYRDGDDTAPSEWRRLEFAQRVTAPVPKPIAADLESAWFRCPAVVMSRLPGRPDVTPKDTDSWVAGLAQTLAQLHQTPLDGAEDALPPPTPTETWEPPAGEHDPLVAAAVGAVTARLPSLSSERVFAHGDFHPGNVLWHRGRISGVVDWSAARLDARWSEVARTAGPTCVCSSGLTSPIAWPTHIRTSSALPPTTLPCMTSCGFSTYGSTPRWPLARTENKAMQPTSNCRSHTSMSNCGEY